MVLEVSAVELQVLASWLYRATEAPTTIPLADDSSLSPPTPLWMRGFQQIGVSFRTPGNHEPTLVIIRFGFVAARKHSCIQGARLHPEGEWRNNAAKEQ